MQTDFATAFLRWTFIRAVLARGYWLTTALYLVVVAHLTPFELVMIGTFQAITVVVAEIPAGAATMHSYGTPHYTGANRSRDRHRRAYIFNVAARGSFGNVKNGD